ncbi:hypothetical protein K9S39_41145 [Streptomyces halobius]|uniref:Transposase n=1 Tax=Streptomyces halobius TaxID=2879846 RepID=A0ABY4MLW0_9ACTN|nr:hypothetical protein [Streptomyces halobius]UQA97420.1 hypothetical protein K9S39_41145 [Streptomyces halobius]
MTDVAVSAEAVEEVKPTELKPDALDDQLLSRLVDRAKADGSRLSGEGRAAAAADEEDPRPG